MLIECAPTMPQESGITRKACDQTFVLSATDKLMPELNVDGLMAADGKCLILFMTRRCAATERVRRIPAVRTKPPTACPH